MGPAASRRRDGGAPVIAMPRAATDEQAIRQLGERYHQAHRDDDNVTAHKEILESPH